MMNISIHCKLTIIWLYIKSNNVKYYGFTPMYILKALVISSLNVLANKIIKYF